MQIPFLVTAYEQPEHLGRPAGACLTCLMRPSRSSATEHDLRPPMRYPRESTLRCARRPVGWRRDHTGAAVESQRVAEWVAASKVSPPGPRSRDGLSQRAPCPQHGGSPVLWGSLP
jgi:hypothetical protein